MILRDFPRLHPNAPSDANEGYRRWFYSRWGRENAVVLGRARHIEFPPFTQTLSIKRAWGGQEAYLLGARQVSVDDDHCLVLNEGAHYGARIASATAVTSMAVFFRPGMAAEVAAGAAQPAPAALDAGAEAPRADCSFAEHLRPLVDSLGRQLDALRDAVLAGERDEQWLEERLQTLLMLMLQAEPGWRDRSLRLAGVCRTAHAELLTRVDRATDFILSCYAQPLTLAQIAGAARLSRFHLVRVFREVHGITPVALLTRTRVRAAEQLLRDPALSLEDVAELSGFGSRHTLFRQLRRHCGDGGRALRQRVALDKAALSPARA